MALRPLFFYEETERDMKYIILENSVEEDELIYDQ